MGDYRTPTGDAQTFTINVSNSGASHYVLSGADRSVTHSSANDPTVTLVVGDTVNFVVNASGHPFYIKTAASTGTGDQASGVTNNGAQSGTVFGLQVQWNLLLYLPVSW